MANGKGIISNYTAHVEQRRTIENYWDEAFRYTLPHRGQTFLGNTTDGFANANAAKNEQATIYDSTAIDAVRLLASSIISGLTPANSQWFSLSVKGVEQSDLPYDVVEWLQTASKNLFKSIHTSNYNAQAFEFFQDISIAGMVGLFVDKDVDGQFNFEVWPLGSLYVSESMKKGKIDTVYRTLHLSASEAVNLFGKSKLPETIQETYQNKPTDLRTFEFIHCIRPRIVKGKQSQGKLSTQLPFESIYVCRKSGLVVKESGFNEFPVVIPRWSQIPNTAYALGPVNDCLPDIKTLNKTIEMMLSNAEMAIAGTFVAKHDGILNPNTIKIGPRRVVFASDTRNIQPLASGGNFQIAFEEINRLQTQVKQIMMADELSPMQKNYASATEVTVRAQIIRQILGPVYARLQSEYLQPLLERCFGLALRDGSLGTPPAAIAGVELSIEYQSPMARAQKMEEISAMDQYEQAIANFAQIDESILDLYNTEEAYRYRSELIGVPARVMRSRDQVTTIRQTQAEVQVEQQADMEMSGEMLPPQ